MNFERREHELRADLARVKEARDFADRCALDFGFPADGRYQLKLAMSEAVTNAIQHGSSSEQGPIWLSAVAEATGRPSTCATPGASCREWAAAARWPRAAAGSSSCAG